MFYRLDSNTRLVIHHGPRKRKKWYHFPSEETLSQFFGQIFSSQKLSAYFSEKYFVLHLRLTIRQNCTDTSPVLIEKVVRIKIFLKKPQKFATKNEKNLQNSSEKKISKTHPKKTKMFRQKITATNSCCSIDKMALVHYSVSQSAWAWSQKIRKKYHLPSGKSILFHFLSPIFWQRKIFGRQKIYGMVN